MKILLFKGSDCVAELERVEIPHVGEELDLYPLNKVYTVRKVKRFYHDVRYQSNADYVTLDVE